MDKIEPGLYADPQRQRERRCPVCDGCVYPPTYFCIRCERGKQDDTTADQPRL